MIIALKKQNPTLNAFRFQLYKTFLSTIYDFRNKLERSSSASLMFAGKAGAYPKVELLKVTELLIRLG
jgi:hypothetical protein